MALAFHLLMTFCYTFSGFELVLGKVKISKFSFSFYGKLPLDLDQYIYAEKSNTTKIEMNEKFKNDFILKLIFWNMSWINKKKNNKIE